MDSAFAVLAAVAGPVASFVAEHSEEIVGMPVAALDLVPCPSGSPAWPSAGRWH